MALALVAQPARSRLAVVRDAGASYSALPHAVLFSGLSDGAVRLYAVLQAHWWQGTESYASHTTMAAEMGCSLSSLRRHLNELIEAGLIAERLAGTRRSKVYICLPIRQKRGIEATSNTSPVTDCEPFNTSKTEIQYVKIDDSNTSKPTYSYKKTPVKKKQEEERDTGVPPVVAVAGAERATTTATDQSAILKALSDDARDVLDWWRQCHGKKRPPRLNPTQARLLEEAVSDLGTDRLKEAVQYMAGRGVPEIDKARTAAYTKRSQDEEAGISSPPKPTVNCAASPLTPATDDDLAIWQRAIDIASTTMNRSNVDAYLSPLVVAGRVEDGGLCLVAPLGIGPDLKRYKRHITRALEDAGDPAPLAVAFKARRSQETHHAE